MKLKNMTIGALAAGFLLISVPVPAMAAEKQPSASTKRATEKCETRKQLLVGFASELELYQKNYYLPPADMSKYETKELTQIDKQKRPTYTGKGTVQIYKKGKLVDAQRVNYDVILERHRGARGVAEAKAGMAQKESFKKYSARILEFRDARDSASKKITDSVGAWKENTKNMDCSSKAGRDGVLKLTRERTTQRKDMNKDLKEVKTKARATSSAYKAVAKDYRAKPKN